MLEVRIWQLVISATALSGSLFCSLSAVEEGSGFNREMDTMSRGSEQTREERMTRRTVSRIELGHDDQIRNEGL